MLEKTLKVENTKLIKLKTNKINKCNIRMKYFLKINKIHIGCKLNIN